MDLSAIFPSFCLAIIVLGSTLSSGYEVTYDDRAIKIDGQRKLILSGSIHYPRSTPGMWPSLIKKSKEGGLNTIETYVFWNAHEPKPRQYDFSGNLDLVRFIKTIRDEGLYAILRIGPYACAEWTYGGFPIWLHSLPGIALRTNNDVFKNEMQIFTAYIVDMMKREGLFASQGGPIILAQIENEYGNVEWAYGDDGKKYVEWCAKMVQDFRIGIPWIMCQQDDAPSPILSTCNGWYCDQWNPRNSIPKIWTENWSGWFMDWGNRVPHRTAEDLAFAVARFFQLGGTVQNYYMYHGGTNFGRTAGGPYITTSYDYDAPLDEYGNTRQPKWGHLKNLHLALMSMEESLTNGEKSGQDHGNNLYVSMFSYQGKRSCFFSNADESSDRTLTFEGTDYFLPAWSVSILPDCYTEVFNTAKVNAQTSIMVKKPNESDDFGEPYALEWQWRTENIPHLTVKGDINGPYSSMASNVLVDQKRATNGSSDYLWLLTTYVHNSSDPQWGKNKNIILHVHTNGHLVHAFVNGRCFGSQWAENGHFEFIFEKRILLKNGHNAISLVSATVGLPNYGDHFDTVRSGIRGPVKLIARSKTGEPDVVKDISSSRWVYKSGLIGEDERLHQVKARNARGWNTLNLPSNKPFIWYKTTFKGPMGSDPVVVDLLGLGKGVAWINGRNIGRYWPKYLASEHGCDVICDYRAGYKPEKCNTGCGKPSQRYYHVPRDWLKEDDNELVLFEELGGNPSVVSFQTVTVGKVCANAYEGHTLELACHPGGKFSNINFASFGLPKGDCGHFSHGACHSERSLSVVEEACLGKEKCVLQATEDAFGSLRCHADAYRLAVEAVC